MGSAESQLSITTPEVAIIEHEHENQGGAKIHHLNKFYADDIYVYFIEFLEEHCDTSDSQNYVSYVEFSTAFMEYMRDICGENTTTYEIKELLDVLVKRFNDEVLDVKIDLKGFRTAYEFMFYKGVKVKSFP